MKTKRRESNNGDGYCPLSEAGRLEGAEQAGPGKAWDLGHEGRHPSWVSGEAGVPWFSSLTLKWRSHGPQDTIQPTHPVTPGLRLLQGLRSQSFWRNKEGLNLGEWSQPCKDEDWKEGPGASPHLSWGEGKTDPLPALASGSSPPVRHHVRAQSGEGETDIENFLLQQLFLVFNFFL